jgi:predicted transcriptional regulator
MPPKSMKRRLDPALQDELDREAEKTKRRKMGPSMETPSKSKPKQEQLAALKVLLAEGVLVTTEKLHQHTPYDSSDFFKQFSS